MNNFNYEDFVLILANEEDYKDHDALKNVLKSEYKVDCLRANPREITSNFTSEGPLFYYKGISIKPSLVLGWVFEDILNIGMNLLYAFENSGIPVINKAQTLFCGQNKYLNSEALHRNSIPHFPVLSGFSDKNIHYFSEGLSYPLVHKQIVSAGGQSVIKVESEELLKDLARTFAQYNESYYVQPYTEKPDRDIRILCIDYQTVSGFYKYTPKGEWVTNVARGGKPEMLEYIDEDLSLLAEKAAKALGARIAGIDILEDPNGGYRVLEVNTCPNFYLKQFMPESTDITERKVAAMIFQEMSKVKVG